MNNLTQESRDSIASNNSVKTIDKPSRISVGELHKYVLGLIGIFGSIVITYPIAMNRVSRQAKFVASKSHLKSLTLEYKPTNVEIGRINSASKTFVLVQSPLNRSPLGLHRAGDVDK